MKKITKELPYQIIGAKTLFFIGKNNTHCGTNLLIVKQIQPILIPSKIIPVG